MHNEFIEAIHSQHKLRLTFYSKEDNQQLVRTCAPMDYGPSRRTHDRNDRYHFWDYDSDTRSHTLSLLPEQIIKIERLSVTFEPVEFITWNTKNSPWFIQRDWGKFS
jgi:hypothetical protein